MYSDFFAIILARGGSKTIPNKNIKKLHNTNCLELTINSLLTVLPKEKILVSSDSSLIGDIALNMGVIFLKRPSDLSSDKATSESAWKHAIQYLAKENCFPETIIAPQVTSPLRYLDTFKNALKKFKIDNYDSLFSATEVSKHSFEWLLEESKNKLSPLNYDPYRQRKRRQDNEIDENTKIRENGSFFIFKREGFLKYSNRFFGKTGFFIQDKLESIEIDEPLDWILAEAVLKANEDLFIY